MTDLQRYAWPIGALGDALATLRQKEKLGGRPVTSRLTMPAAIHWDEATLNRWIDGVAAESGLEAEPTQAAYAELAQLISHAAPALVRLPVDGIGNGVGSAPRFLLLYKPRRYKRGQMQVALLGPDRAVHWVAPTIIQDALCGALIAPHQAALQPVLTRSQLPPQRRARVERAVLGEILGGKPIAGCWLLRLPPSAPLRQQLAKLRLPAAVRLLLIGFVAQLLISLLGWWLIGRSVLVGHFEWGWLTAWALLLLTALPFQWLTNLAQSQLATSLGSFFKQRLLYGALQLQPDAVRHEGAGHFLGRVLASDALEQLALGGGFVALLALLQVGIAGVVLALGIGGGWHAALLGGWLLFTLGLGYRYFVDHRAWNHMHRALTNDLVERMVGHRTRLAQEDRAHWHDTEDGVLQVYLDQLQRADQSGGWFKAIVVRGWMGLGLGWLFLTLGQGQPAAATVAVSLGGVLLAQQALSSIVLGVQSVVAALLAWQEVRLLFQAAIQPPAMVPAPNVNVLIAPSSLLPALQNPVAPPRPRALLTLHEVEFRYRAGGRAIVQNGNLEICEGDRLLLEGPSGGGKSTLAALLTGLQLPTSGLLLLGGLDQQTIGSDYWRQRVVAAPQFHENHVLTGSLAFNLLMGRRWPPQPEDLVAAEMVCQELGLGELLARMPAGLQQIVGESGWQLSHGERSRLYIARAILQQADLIILDESFGALDPVTLEGALRAVLARARTLLVIAHP